MPSLWVEVSQRKALVAALAVAFAAQVHYSGVVYGGLALFLIVLGVSVNALRSPHREKPWAYLRLPLLLVAVGAVALTLYYVPTIHFDPEVNWTLKPGSTSNEVDPGYIVLYFPAAQFLFTLGCFGLSGGLAFMSRRSAPRAA